MDTYGQELGFSLAQVAMRAATIRLWLASTTPAG
jgi:hypothetical protein